MSGVRLSRDEFRRLAQRALQGAGAPPGTDEDGAALALWLAERRLPGARACLAACRALAQGFRTPTAAGRTVDARGMPALMLAESLLDVVSAEGPEPAWTVERLAAPWTLLAAAWRRGGDLLPLAVAAETGRSRWSAVVTADGLQADPASPRTLCRMPEARVTLCRGPAGPRRAPILSRDLLDDAAPGARSGIRLAAGIHAALGAFAARTLVPADERSRARGAGPGEETGD